MGQHSSVARAQGLLLGNLNPQVHDPAVPRGRWVALPSVAQGLFGPDGDAFRAGWCWAGGPPLRALGFFAAPNAPGPPEGLRAALATGLGARVWYVVGWHRLPVGHQRAWAEALAAPLRERNAVWLLQAPSGEGIEAVLGVLGASAPRVVWLPQRVCVKGAWLPAAGVVGPGWRGGARGRWLSSVGHVSPVPRGLHGAKPCVVRRSPSGRAFVAKVVAVCGSTPPVARHRDTGGHLREAS